MANVRVRVSKIDILGQFKPNYLETYFNLCLQVWTAMSPWASLYGEFSIRPQTHFPLRENMDVICQTLGLYLWWGYLDSHWTQKCTPWLKFIELHILRANHANANLRCALLSRRLFNVIADSRPWRTGVITTVTMLLINVKGSTPPKLPWTPWCNSGDGAQCLDKCQAEPFRQLAVSTCEKN